MTITFFGWVSTLADFRRTVKRARLLQRRRRQHVHDSGHTVRIVTANRAGFAGNHEA